MPHPQLELTPVSQYGKYPHAPYQFTYATPACVRVDAATSTTTSGRSAEVRLTSRHPKAIRCARTDAVISRSASWLITSDWSGTSTIVSGSAKVRALCSASPSSTTVTTEPSTSLNGTRLDSHALA